MPVPTYDRLFNPTLHAIKRLGGSASIAELNEEVTKSLGLTNAEISQPHTNGRQTRLEYRLAWARTYLKAYGLLDNSERGVWSLTPKGKASTSVNPRELKKVVIEQRRKNKLQIPDDDEAIVESGGLPQVAEAILDQGWREELLAALLQLRPDAFERLCQRLLRESGFVQVTVTGKSGDGGIDGVGLVRLGGLLSFPIIFQCKRYQGSVGAGVIRDFRGAMIGRADRGLIITTGTFTRDARAEATRDGAPPVDLVDGEQLLDKLKELRLGVAVKMIEEVSVDAEWLQGL